MEQKVINCPHCGRIISKAVFSEKKPPSVKCQMCGSVKSCRDGFRSANSGKIQRYLCRDCGYRFS